MRELRQGGGKSIILKTVKLIVVGGYSGMKVFVWPPAAAAVGALPLGWGIANLAQSGYMLTSVFAWLLGAAALTGLVSFVAIRSR